LVDYHTHILDSDPPSVYPVIRERHFLAGKAIIFHALSSGITALREQICGHPLCNFSKEDYQNAVQELTLDVPLQQLVLQSDCKIGAFYIHYTVTQC
jgi:hypothetical protein